MKKNVILATLVGVASGFFAGLAATELLKLRAEKQVKRPPRALPAPQIVVELPPEQENENIPQKVHNYQAIASCTEAFERGRASNRNI